MSKIIKQILPNPLLTSIVEIRFTSDLLEENVLDFFFKLYGNSFPKVTDNQAKIPRETKKLNPHLEFSPDYIFSNDTYSISVSNNVIAFENISEYQLWSNYFLTIQSELSKLLESEAIKSITRIGVRYTSVFEKVDFKTGLNARLTLDYDNYNQALDVYKTILSKDDIQLNLIIINSVKAHRKEEEKTGLYIDIDTSQETNLPSQSEANIFEIIQTLHSEEKKFFTNLMNFKSLSQFYTVTYE